MIPTVPVAPRNRLAHLVLAALSDPAARRALADLGTAASPPAGWLAVGVEQHAEALLSRARRASEVLSGRPLLPPLPSLGDALAAAADLFEAGLGFEVHELLEPFWLVARDETRLALQGLIKIAVGYQHLANGNVAGARLLLADGASGLRRGRIEGLELDRFVAAVLASLERLDAFDWSRVPGFPRPSRIVLGASP
jgi:DUF309 family protein family protein